MKKFLKRSLLCMVVAASVLSTSLLSCVSASELREVRVIPEGKGDLNGDSMVDYVDYIMFRKNILGEISLDSVALEKADVNGDGLVNLDDLAYFPSPVSGKAGDINNDGQFNALDIACFKAYLLGKYTLPVEPEPIWKCIWDVNGDGKIDCIDFALFRRYILGMISEFPIQRYMVNPSENPSENPGFVLN